MRNPSVAISAVLLALSTAACGAGTTAAVAPSASAAASPIDQWAKAYAFLAGQTKPTEIACTWLTNTAGKAAPAPRVAAFYTFSDTSSWMPHTITRTDKLPSGTFEECVANVPTDVPYGPEIESFLAARGLVFSTTAPGLTPIEIAYAGQNASDPDIIYRDKPGLFGLRLALAGLGAKPFVAGTSKIVQPSDAATASQYLRYAQPLLAWYGYTG